MEKSALLSFVRARFGNNILIRGNEIRVNCPNCKVIHKRSEGHKLYINYVKEIFHCVKCDWSGGLILLFPNATVSALQLNIPKVQEVIPVSVIEPLPKGNLLHKLPYEHPGWQYLFSRLYHPNYIPQDTIYVDDYVREAVHFGPRIIFPIRFKGQYCGFQGRTTNNHPIRYVSGLHTKKSTVLYGWDEIVQQTSSAGLVINEGIFDKLRVQSAGYKSVATLGKSISDEQIHFLLTFRHKFSYIIIYYDSDALDRSEAAARKLGAFFSNTYFVVHFVKDPGASTVQEIHNLFQTTGIYSKNQKRAGLCKIS